MPIGIYEQPPPAIPGLTAVEVNRSKAATAAKWLTSATNELIKPYRYITWP